MVSVSLACECALVRSHKGTGMLRYFPGDIIQRIPTRVFLILSGMVNSRMGNGTPTKSICELGKAGSCFRPIIHTCVRHVAHLSPPISGWSKLGALLVFLVSTFSQGGGRFSVCTSILMRGREPNKNIIKPLTSPYLRLIWAPSASPSLPPSPHNIQDHSCGKDCIWLFHPAFGCPWVNRPTPLLADEHRPCVNPHARPCLLLGLIPSLPFPPERCGYVSRPPPSSPKIMEVFFEFPFKPAPKKGTLANTRGQMSRKASGAGPLDGRPGANAGLDPEALPAARFGRKVFPPLCDLNECHFGGFVGGEGGRGCA